MRLLAGLAWLGVCLLALAGGTVWNWINSSAVAKALVIQQIRKTPPKEVFHNQDSLTFLVLGCDEDRYYGGKQILSNAARSDMMLIARLDFLTNKITAVSIPRDTVVDMPGYSRRRINAFHALGKNSGEGGEYAKRAVEFLLDNQVRIDRVMEINYKAFQDMINLVGGVNIFVDKKMEYTDKRGGLFIDLKPGKQTLDGYNAMCYVRYRHGDSDFLRQDRQKNLMTAFKNKLEGQPQLLGKVADKVREVLGNELSAEEVAAVAIFAKEIGNDNIKMGQLPTYELPRPTRGSPYYLALDRDKARETLARFGFIESYGSSTYRYEP
ncbi:MAG: LCP family protein [Armatimonadetes bacterium]|nr:LCP family protein [Armatimonadota bacterium]